MPLARLFVFGVAPMTVCTGADTGILLGYWQAVWTKAWGISGEYGRGGKLSERTRCCTRESCTVIVRYGDWRGR
jgi:hypothetical protein